MIQSPKKVDAVFEGGGVTGIALVGAVAAIEAAGYQFANVAGTSAGAIVASLLAAGYSAAEVKEAIDALDFSTFLDASIPVVGPVLDLVFHHGLFKGDVFLHKMRELLAKKNVHTFKDLICEDPASASDPRYRFKLRVIASDISRRRMLVLPQDIKAYGKEPEDLEVALAVRMSMSIPF